LHPTLIYIEDNTLIPIARKLFLEYAESLHFNLCFQNFEKELAELPGDYAPPLGCIILVKAEEEFFGCVALRKLEDDVCEMKRLYIKPECRGMGIGKKLTFEIIDFARKSGYKKMRLDTIATMKEAIGIYKAIGFYEIPAYRYNPEKEVIYLELGL
jgi:putative acetyltransferase